MGRTTKKIQRIKGRTRGYSRPKEPLFLVDKVAQNDLDLLHLQQSDYSRKLGRFTHLLTIHGGTGPGTKKVNTVLAQINLIT